jgi:hypothetical protein
VAAVCVQQRGRGEGPDWARKIRSYGFEFNYLQKMVKLTYCPQSACGLVFPWDECRKNDGRRKGTIKSSGAGGFPKRSF